MRKGSSMVLTCYTHGRGNNKNTWEANNHPTLNLTRRTIRNKDPIRYRVFRKNVFFTIHCNPSIANIAVRDLQSSQRNARVQSLLLAGNFFEQPIAAEGWRGRGDKFSRILGKNTIFDEHPEHIASGRTHRHSNLNGSLRAYWVVKKNPVQTWEYQFCSVGLYRSPWSADRLSTETGFL